MDGRTLDESRLIVEKAKSCLSQKEREERESRNGKKPTDERCFHCGKSGHWYDFNQFYNSTTGLETVLMKMEGTNHSF
jgi:hypothetical protein